MKKGIRSIIRSAQAAAGNRGCEKKTKIVFTTPVNRMTVVFEGNVKIDPEKYIMHVDGKPYFTKVACKSENRLV